MSATETESKTDIRNALRLVLADSYALMGLTHLCHWNVEGPNFFALHQAFEEEYTELFTAIDEIAERIRAIGGYAPGSLAKWAEMAEVEEIPERATASEMVKGLISANRKLISDAAGARDAAADAGDKETEDMMIARIQVHEKTVWMLDSYLKT